MTICGLNEGTVFEFDACVDSYTKGYQGRLADQLGCSSFETDYHLERPTKVVVIGDKQDSGDIVNN